jgi:tetratricopeptide (TPR) repeat protein
MFKNPWFTLVIGLMVGLALGYVFAEQQRIPPGKALRLGAPQAAEQADGLPNGHPPLDEGGSNPESKFFEQQIAEIQGLMAQNPGDVGLKVSMADAFFELARTTGNPSHWQESRVWYETAMAEGRGNDPDVLTDLAVVLRNMEQYDRSLEVLDRATAVAPDHWQAWFNKVIVMNFDLHDHDGAQEAFGRLKEIAGRNPEVPDLAAIEAEVMGK